MENKALFIEYMTHPDRIFFGGIHWNTVGIKKIGNRSESGREFGCFLNEFSGKVRKLVGTFFRWIIVFSLDNLLVCFDY